MHLVNIRLAGHLDRREIGVVRLLQHMEELVNHRVVKASTEEQRTRERHKSALAQVRRGFGQRPVRRAQALRFEGLALPIHITVVVDDVDVDRVVVAFEIEEWHAHHPGHRRVDLVEQGQRCGDHQHVVGIVRSIATALRPNPQRVAGAALADPGASRRSRAACG